MYTQIIKNIGGCKMSKREYAFIIQSENLTPDEYMGSFESDSFVTNVYGVN